MTAQINDTFRYRGVEYAIAGISEGELFDVTSLNLRPAGTCTACWRGYQAVFAAPNSRLALAGLHLNLFKGKSTMREQGPVINGVTPTPGKGDYDLLTITTGDLIILLRTQAGCYSETGLSKSCMFIWVFILPGSTKA